VANAAPVGSGWDVTNPKKPVVEQDPDASLIWQWDWSTWCTERGTTIASVAATAELPLLAADEAVTDDDKGALITVSIDPDEYDATAHLRKKFGVTCRVTSADGQVDDMTFWFRLVEK